jgi:uncharacterized protein
VIARRSAPVLVAAVAGLAMATVSAKQSTEAQASITLPNGATVRVEIADTDATRARGLMFRNALALDEGMLFLFDEPGLHAFWMKNTLISLDIIWLDDDGRIVSIAHAVAPCKADPCSHYSPSAEACAVLEVRSGLVTLHELKVGDTVKLDGLKTGSRCRAQDAKTRCPLAFGRKPPATDGAAGSPWPSVVDVERLCELDRSGLASRSMLGWSPALAPPLRPSRDARRTVDVLRSQVGAQVHAVRRPCQESRVYERVQQFRAHRAIQRQESSRLSERQPQPWHLEKFAPYSLQQMVSRHGVTLRRRPHQRSSLMRLSGGRSNVSSAGSGASGRRSASPRPSRPDDCASARVSPMECPHVGFLSDAVCPGKLRTSCFPGSHDL